MSAQFERSTSNVQRPTSNDGFESMPVVVVKYHGLQQGFAQLAPMALFNVVGGEVPDLIGSTVLLQSLHAKGYQIREVRSELSFSNAQPSTPNS